MGLHARSNELSSGKKAGKDRDMKWTNYFDVILVAGNKPGFLVDDRGALPLSVSELDTSTLCPKAW